MNKNDESPSGKNVKAHPKISALQSASLATRLLVIALVVLVVGALAIAVVSYFELCSLPMAATALLVCVISSLVAHIAGEYPTGKENFAARLALSMGVRTGIPFLAVIAAKLAPSIPFEAGFVFLIILFYLVGLIVDVSLHAVRLKPSE